MVDVCDWLYKRVCVQSMYTYVSLWVIKDKEMMTSSGDEGTRRRGRWTGERETCMGNRDTRVVKVNSMSTSYIDGVFLSFVDVYVVLEQGRRPCKNTNRAVVRAVQTNRRRRESSRSPSRSSSLDDARVVRSCSSSSRPIDVTVREQSLASRVTPSRLAVERTTNRSINHDDAREMSSPPIGGVVARARDRDRGRVSSPRDDRRDGRASRR